MQAMRLTRLAPFLAVLGLVMACASANAQLLQIRVYDPATGAVATVQDNLDNDTNPLPNQITVDTGWLNTELGAGRAFDFVALGASSNFDEVSSRFSRLSTTGQVEATTVPGVLPIFIDTTQTGWDRPGPNPRWLDVTGGATFTNTRLNASLGGPPDDLLYVANNNPNNSPFGGVAPGTPPPYPGFDSATILFQSNGDPLISFASNPPIPGMFVENNPYALTNFIRIATGPSAPDGGPLRNIQFITSATKDAVPEPGSLAMLASLGLSGGLFGLRLRRK